MNKLDYIFTLSLLSGMISLLEKLFGDINVSFMILVSLIVIDTLTGIITAFKFNIFHSKGLSKLIKKTTSYTLAILTIRLLEIGAVSLVQTNMLSLITIVFLQVTEVISILENLTLLGVPIPSSFMTILINHMRIPGLNKAIELSKNKDNELTEIDELINYHIPTFTDENIKTLLEIRLNSSKIVVFQINKIFRNNKSIDNDLLLLKILSIIELETNNIERLWEEANIPKKYVKDFIKERRLRVEKYIKNIEKICYSETDLEYKRKQIVSNLVVTMYQVVLDAHKI